MLFGAGYHRGSFQFLVVKVFRSQPGLPVSLSGSEIGRAGQIAVGEHAAIVVDLNCPTRIITQAFQITDGGERLDFGAAAADRYGWISIRADDQDGLNLVLIEW